MQDTCLPPAISSPAGLIEQLNATSSGCFYVSDNAMEWWLYVQQGKLIYATNSIDPFERLERHLRSLPQQSSLSNNDLRAQVRQFEQHNRQNHITADYQALRWLIDAGHCDGPSLANLASKMVTEVLESFLLLPEGDYELQQHSLTELPPVCQLDLLTIWPRLWDRLDQWNAMPPHISSPYQRPYLVKSELAEQELSPGIAEKLSRLLLGFNFRQLGMLLQQDELALCRQFIPLIRKGIIVLQEPLAPQNRLPRLNPSHLKGRSASQDTTPAEMEDRAEGHGPSEGRSAGDFLQADSGSNEQRTWKIACIDDSPAVLQEIQRFLQQDIFEITMIEDSQKALMKIVSLKPDLVLLDAGMPGMDGYQVCSMIRKSSVLKDTPVVMVTGNRGLLDRARAKTAGATDYLTKPFTQQDLLQMVLRYLSE